MTEDVNVYVPGVKHVEVEFISWFTTWNKKLYWPRRDSAAFHENISFKTIYTLGYTIEYHNWSKMRVNRLTKLVSVHAKKIQFIAHAMLTINRTVLCCQTYKPTLQYSSR